MVQSRWVDADAAKCGGDLLALRVYSSRLMSRSPCNPPGPRVLRCEALENAHRAWRWRHPLHVHLCVCAPPPARATAGQPGPSVGSCLKCQLTVHLAGAAVGIRIWFCTAAATPR